MTKFMVMNVGSAYNGIIEQMLLHAMKVVVSTYYQMIKFLTSDKIGWHEVTRRNHACYHVSTGNKEIGESLPIEGIDMREELQNQGLIGAEPALENVCFVKSI